MPVKLNADAKKALAGWRVEAARLREERQTDPNAFTTTEFAEESGISESTAHKYLSKRVAEGAYKRARKLVRGKIVPAWTEAK
jgi:response regulator of citrate/malate metabolism